MPSPNQSQLNQQLDNLLTLSKEEILNFFKADLDGLDVKKIIGNLKMLMMFTDAAAAEEMKKQILNNLSEKSRKIAELEQYLKTRAYDEIMAQIPIKEHAVAKPSLHPQDYVQMSFPKNDHFDFEDARDIDQFHKIGAKYQWHNFDEEWRNIMSVLPSETRTELEKDHLLKKRLENIMITYLKDVRDELETRQRLSASKQLCGMGFDYDLVNDIFQVLQNRHVKAKAPQNFKLKVPQPPPALPHGQGKPAVAIPINQINQKIIARPIDAQRIIRISQASGKNIISDIKHPPPKLISPAQEFSALTLEDLRKHGLETFIKNILIKIDGLTRENYVYRIQAIGAWKKSPLYKQYMEIGQESLNKGKNVKEHLSSGDGKNQLNYAEFEAIGALNQKLRF